MSAEHGRSTAMEQSFQHDLFVSFSYHDQEFARSVYNDLRSSGIDAFFSDETLRNDLGTAFAFKIQDGLEGSRHFVLVASDNAFKSEWVSLEWQTFFTQIHLKDPDQRRIFILPVADYDVRLRPLFLQRFLPAASVRAIVESVRPTRLAGPSRAAETPDRSSLEKRAVELFGQFRVQDVDRTLLGRHLGLSPEDLSRDVGLNQSVTLVSQVASELEQLAAGRDTTSLMSALVRQLDSFRRFGSTQKARVMYELVRRRFYSSWGEDQISRFGQAVRLIFDYQDAYVSYTNRDAHIINTQYRPLIRRLLPPQERRDLDEENLVARAVIHHLQRQQVTIWSWRLDPAAEPSEAMRQHAAHSLVLIQLLELGSFTLQPRNWMFEEYQSFMSSTSLGDPGRQNRYLPIVLGNVLETPVFTPIEYQPWLDHIRSIDYIKLASADAKRVQSRLSDLAEIVWERRGAMLRSLLSN